jgi:ABC-type transport system substrate-binding protein
MATSVEQAKHLQAARDAHKLIVDQAYVVTLYKIVSVDVISKQVKDYSIDRLSGLRFWNTYIEP